MSSERKGKKLRRQPKAKSYYAAQPMRTATNKKRRMRNHIRSNPGDAQAKRTYSMVKNFGPADSFGLNCRGRKLKKRSEMRIDTMLRVALP